MAKKKKTLADSHNVENTALLLAHGAQIDVLNSSDYTPLEQALRTCSNHADIIENATIHTNAYEVLEKTPGIIVDQDGKIYLSSTTPATVYINGREIKMSA